MGEITNTNPNGVGRNAGNKPTRLEEMKAKHRQIMRMEVLGFSNAEIAKDVCYTPAAVYNIRQSPLYKSELARLQSEADEAAKEKSVSLKVKKVFVDEAEESARKLARLRDNAKEGSVQLKSAMEILDRAGYTAKNRESSPLINITITDRQMQDIDKADEYLSKQG